MKISLPRQDLVAALNIVRGAISPKATNPILANVSLSVKGKKLELTGTDLDVTIRTSIGADVESPGSCTVKANLLYNIVSSFTGVEPVDLEAAKDDIAIKCGQSKYKLGTLPADDFPPAVKLADVLEVELPQAVLHSLLTDTAFCQGTDASRFVLCGSLVRLDGSITVVGCDGRRLACESALLEMPPDKKMDSILPPATVRQLLRLLSPDVAKADKTSPLVTMQLTANAAQFKFDETIVTTKLIDGAYPDYTKVIPKNLEMGISVSRVDLLNAIKRVHLISSTCSLIFKGQSLTITGRGSKEIPGEAVEMLLIPFGKDVIVNFHTQLLIEALNAPSDDEVVIHVKESAGSTPMVMKVTDKDWLAVTMPIAKAAEQPPAKPVAKPAAEKKPAKAAVAVAIVPKPQETVPEAKAA